jgi:uncharacterized protein (DUF2062 family)
VFKRRHPLTSLQKAREWIWPRNGLRRALEYLGHRIRRLPDSPHKIAKGLAAGVFVSFTPFFGFHFIVAALLAFAVRGNILASLIGTFFGNPVTFPFIVTISLWFGRTLYGLGEHGGSGTEFDIVALAFAKAFIGAWTAAKSLFYEVEAPLTLLKEFMSELFVPYLVGGIVPGLMMAVLVYVVSLPLVDAYQTRRRNRFNRRRDLKTKIARPASKKS